MDNVTTKMDKTAKDYNWWEDPDNKEEIEKYSWWDHPANKETLPLPISVIESDGTWVACFNKDTEKLFGKYLHGVGQGKTKEEAIAEAFYVIRLMYQFEQECRLNYQRWVPFRKGKWGHIGGNWFVVFGIHVYFRYGKGNKGGSYIPFTKLNVRVSSEWTLYRNYMKRLKDEEEANKITNKS
jgi:predicted RNase H-like HicB family nuclease